MVSIQPEVGFAGAAAAGAACSWPLANCGAGAAFAYIQFVAKNTLLRARAEAGESRANVLIDVNVARADGA